MLRITRTGYSEIFNDAFFEKQSQFSGINPNQEISNKVQCVRCKEYFNSSDPDIKFAPDPYQAEINNNDTPVWECEHCREDSAGDI